MNNFKGEKMSKEQNQGPTRFQEPHVGNAEAIQAPTVPSETKGITVRADQSGLLVGTTMDEQWRLAKAYHASGMLPKQYSTPEKILIGMQFAYELGLKPLTAMRQISVINGTPSMYGDLPLAVCRGSGKLEMIREYFVDTNGKRISNENGNLLAEVFGAVCETKRKEFADPVVTAFTVEDAKRAGLWGKNVWAVYPKRMLQMRARSQNLKDNFSDMINGLAIAEYDYNVTGEEIESGKVHGANAGSAQVEPKDLNARLAELEPIKIEDAVLVPNVEPVKLTKLPEGYSVHAEALTPKMPEVHVEPAEKPSPQSKSAPKAKAKAIEPEDKTKRPNADFVFTIGRFEGTQMNHLSDEQLKDYYYQLKAQAKMDGPSESRDDMIEAIGGYLGMRKGV